jgi:hypothetical protein
MRVREAVAEDRAAWDAFADSEGGQFFHYFEWKYVHETRARQYIPLLAETEASSIIGILPITKEKKLLYSRLYSDTHAGGLLLKRGLPDTERCEVISALLKHVDTNYSRGCSRFTVRENLSSINEVSEEPTAALIDSGYSFRYDVLNHLPCTFVLELKPPFEENIWKGLWSKRLRQKLNKVERNGVVVIHDKELNYAADFIEMLSANYERHGTMPLTKEQVAVVLNTFRDRARLYVALLDSRPIAALMCHYYASTCFLWEIGSYMKDIGNANLLCFKAAIKDACDAGYRFVNFGFTATPSLAFFKEQFRGTRVPFRMYEKRYSVTRTLMELGGVLLQRAWHDKTYLWKQRRVLLDRIARW